MFLVQLRNFGFCLAGSEVVRIPELRLCVIPVISRIPGSKLPACSVSVCIRLIARTLMLEVANARKNHRDVVFIGGIDHFLVAHGSARLNDRPDSITCGDQQSVGKREKRIRGQGATLQRKSRFQGAPFNGIDTACLSGSDSQHPRGVGKDDGIGLHVLYHAPSEQKRFQFFRCRRALRDGL